MKEIAQQLISKLAELIDSAQDHLSNHELDEKRKQLHAVNKTIQQLERQKVSIPDDLRNLKTSLISELNETDHADEALRFIDKELNGILDKIGISDRKVKKSLNGSPRSRKKSNAPVTSAEVFRRLIIESIKKSGGSSRCKAVLSYIEQKYDDQFTKRDWEHRTDGTVVWKNNVQWERQSMVDEGILKNNSPRGFWELSEDYQ